MIPHYFCLHLNKVVIRVEFKIRQTDFSNPIFNYKHDKSRCCKL